MKQSFTYVKTEHQHKSDLKQAKKKILKELLNRHAQSRAKISSQCDTLISKKLVEDMIKELE